MAIIKIAEYDVRKLQEKEVQLQRSMVDIFPELNEAGSHSCQAWNAMSEVFMW